MQERSKNAPKYAKALIEGIQEEEVKVIVMNG